MQPRRRFLLRSLALTAATTLAASCAPPSLAQVQPLPAQATQAQAEATLALARAYSAVRYFYPGDAIVRVSWDRFLVDASRRALLVKDNAAIGPMLRTAFGPIARGLEIGITPFDADVAGDPAARVRWQHAGLGMGQKIQNNSAYKSVRYGRDEFDDAKEPITGAATTRFALTDGWYVRMPVHMRSEDALVTPAQDEVLRAIDGLPDWDSGASIVDRAQGAAAAIALWSIAQQFYPYWEEAHVDWDATLRQWVRNSPASQSRGDLLRSLRRLSALLHDGHAGVMDTRAKSSGSAIRIDVRPVGAQWIVTATRLPDQVAVGDEIVRINGRAAAEVMGGFTEMLSGSATTRAWSARYALIHGDPDKKIALVLRGPQGDRHVELVYDALRLPIENASHVTLPPDVAYVSVMTFRKGAFEADLPRLAKAKAVIFDLRGYPSSEAISLAPYWLDHPDEVKWMKVPIRSRPFEAPERFHEFGWNVQPNPALANVRKILLVDGRTISYAESLTGYFAASTGTVIVGEPTAGANGNVSLHELPGGFTFRFTGMVVTDHRGQRIHARGFQPDILVTPTAEGIRAGRDEVLEKAIDIASQ